MINRQTNPASYEFSKRASSTAGKVSSEFHVFTKWGEDCVTSKGRESGGEIYVKGEGNKSDENDE